MTQKINDLYKSVPVIADKIAHIQVDFFKAVNKNDMPAAEQTLLAAAKMIDTHLAKDKQYSSKQDAGGDLIGKSGVLPGIKAPAFPVDAERTKAHTALIVANLFDVSVGVNTNVASGFLPEVKASSNAIMEQLMKSNAGNADLVGRAVGAFTRMEMNF